MSYGLKYIIPFRTISEKSCEIRLEVKDFAGEPTELKAGQTPIRIDTDTSDLLSPIRSSSATIQVFGSDYLQDLYTSDPQGIRVTLLVAGVVKWLGYLTPDTFSQDFSAPEFIYEMEVVAASRRLSTRNSTYRRFCNVQGNYRSGGRLRRVRVRLPTNSENSDRRLSGS